jgi:carbon-monoxide dehydrogenase small subunit
MKKNKTESLAAEKGLFVISLTLNGRPAEFRVKPGDFLLDALRAHGWKGTKKGCDTGDCGSCAVMFNGKPRLACMIPAVTAHGAEVGTIEGVGKVDDPHPVQEAFVEAGAVQCGFCIPGMVISSKHLLENVPDPTEAQIKKALDGNLCRCTGYVKQIEAVKIASKKLRTRKAAK